MKRIKIRIFRTLIYLGLSVAASSSAMGAVGEIVAQFAPPVPGFASFCSIGLTFDGTDLYYNHCSDPNIYSVDPLNPGVPKGMFDPGVAENPNAMAFDAKRNGVWFGTQRSEGRTLPLCGGGIAQMPIYFWDFGDNTVTLMFKISSTLVNPATGSSFLSQCFVDGLAYNENDPATEDDDEIWFSDDIDPNLGVFRPDGTLVRGFDATIVDPSLSNLSGIAIGGQNLYLANDGGGEIFRATRPADIDNGPLDFLDLFATNDTREEDMACDPVTFQPIEVMWVRTSPQGSAENDLITAYEIEPNTCGIGGESPEVMPPDIVALSRTIGFWKNHPAKDAHGNSLLPIDLGDDDGSDDACVSVATQNEVKAILKAHRGRDFAPRLRAQLLAALLNVASGTIPPGDLVAIAPVVNDAQEILGKNNCTPDTGKKGADRNAASALHAALDAFNMKYAL